VIKDISALFMRRSRGKVMKNSHDARATEELNEAAS